MKSSLRNLGNGEKKVYQEIPNITPEFIEKHMDKPWDWGAYGLSRNPCIIPEFIEKHLDRPWGWGKYGLSSNLNILQNLLKTT